jgi:flagellar hook assembly protein FlgD
LDYPSPNPFNNSTLLRYQVHNGGNIKLEIYNLLGEKVTTLYDKYLLQGSYEIFWNGKDNQGNYLPSGIYFVQMKSKTQQDVKKITLLK